MSKLKNASVAASEPANTKPISTGVKTSGTSSCSPTFAGVVAGANIVVVLKANASMSKAVITNNEVVVTMGGANDFYLCVTVDQSDANNWTIPVRTDKEDPNKGETFIAGTGGGGL